MNILGIDPGIRKCGYALICKVSNGISLIEAGFIDFSKEDMQDKMLKLDIELDSIMQKNIIDEVAIEDIFYAHNPSTFIKFSQFRGAICMKVLQKKKILYEYTPLQVKKAITGNGKSKKEQVSFMVSKILGLKNMVKVFDISDAMAVAITHAQRIKNNKISGYNK